ncbi:PAAR domain-containing protein [Herbaspirillum sp. RTI4]|uniref:PAAR domain-containing protein n=1 Tax=Herbaspirillum sp. RTI4 TaxID=3048640 RepID=UPI002AB44823|nr:PAAR domain-containing protein [Herbaspirillum sp. RTI4]MDY7579208.1 PAAR domain-containing protein [Herbaspirillum sp. RTI4]MEA9982659.1 PAAR domain-containing protein [Herbaspirillum sp. RTI4]
MLRKIVVVGDPLSSGGAILDNGNSTFTVGDEGYIAALIGGPVRCDACKSTGTIAKAGGPRRLQFMGEVALEDDIVHCKCSPPPVLKATLHLTTTFDDDAESQAFLRPAVPVQQTHTAASDASRRFDEYFVLYDKQTGQPTSGFMYGMKTSFGEHHDEAYEDGATGKAFSQSPLEVELLYAVQKTMGIR